MSVFTYHVPANMFQAATKAEANALARAYGREQALQARFCCQLNDIIYNIGETVAEVFSITGGTGPFTWERTSGTLPAGLTESFLDSGRSLVISGTTEESAYSPISYTITDTANGLVVTRTLNVQILGIATGAALPDATLLEAYSHQLEGSGGSGGSYYYVLESGDLPNGVTLSEGGLLSGTPTAEGTFNFSVRMYDL